ncbi:MAG: hypothetical protein WDN44_04760 [Sphingomonas sp.]
MLRNVLLAFSLLIPGVARADWQEASSKHFVVYSNDTPEHVRAFTTRLERFDKAIRVFHLAPEDNRGPSARVTVFVVGDVGEIEKLSGINGIAGFYEPRASGSVAFTPRRSGAGADYGLNSQAILFHEYTHHWMLTNWSDAAFPPWFVEGFAELHATAAMRNDGSVVFGAVPLYRAYTVDNTSLLPAEVLVRPNPGHLDPMQRDALYSRGWLLTNYLMFDPARRAQLAAYISAINGGKSAKEAAALLGSTAGLDGRLNAYGTRKQWPLVVIPADKLPIGDVAVRPLSPGEAAIMPARIASAAGVDKARAARVVALARTLAAPYPHDAAVQNELAEAEYDAENYAASEAAADRAIAADPKSVHALVYKGMAEAAAAKKDKVTDPARWQAIRHWFLAANKVDTESPEPLIEFYDSFAAAGQTPSKNAEIGLLYAYALAPYDGDLRMRAGRVYLQQGKIPQARIAIGPVAYNLDEAGKAEVAQKVLAALDSDGAAAALKVLDDAAKPKDDAKKS